MGDAGVGRVGRGARAYREGGGTLAESLRGGERERNEQAVRGRREKEKGRWGVSTSFRCNASFLSLVTLCTSG
jgi:hypothetical protein